MDHGISNSYGLAAFYGKEVALTCMISSAPAVAFENYYGILMI